MQTFKRLLTYLKTQPFAYSSGFLLSFFSAATAIYVPIIGKQIIDGITLAQAQQQKIAFDFLIQKFGWFLILTLLSASSGYAGFVLLAFASNRVSKTIRDEVHAHMQKLPITYFDNKPAGKISARIVNDTEVLRNNFYQNFSNQVVVHLLNVFGLFFALFLVSSKTGATLLLLIPFFVGWQWLYVRLATPINQKWRKIVSELNNQTAEIIQGVSLVQLFHQEQQMCDSFEEQNQAWLKNRIQSIRLDGILSWDFSTFVKNLVMFFLLLYLGTQYNEGILGYSMGTIYILINYLSRLFDPILNLVRMMPTLQQSLAAGQRVFELLDESIEEDTATPLVLQEGKVTFAQVTFGYQTDQPVLKDINLAVKAGQTIGIVGHTGSGKSSLINLLFRFYDPQAGGIFIDEQRIQDCNRESIRAQMGIVLQEPFLFSGTIASNVHMQNPAITEGMVIDALEQVGAQALLAKLPKGIHEPVIEKGQSLSSGERQLIAFARTLAKNPKILILDEATSHIDTQTEEIIQNAMNVLKKGRTTFIIAHRLSTIQQADQIILLDRGEIKEQGTHEALLKKNGQYAQMYRLQAKSVH